MQATAGLRALEGDASDRILQAVIFSLSFSISVVLAVMDILYCFNFVIVSNFVNLR